MRERSSAAFAKVPPIMSRSFDPRIVVAVSSATILVGQLIYRFGLPSFDLPPGPVISFPGTGDVFVTKYADLRHGQSTFSVKVPAVDRNNYVVLLRDADIGRAVMAIYCRSGDQTVAPVPIGTYAVTVASGMDWYGMANLFGTATRAEKILPQMTASRARGTGIDFNRRLDGGLPTRPILKSSFIGQA